jgi:transposase
MSLYCGVDLHGDNGYYAIIDDEGKRVFKKKLPNDVKDILLMLEPYRSQLTEGIAVESTFNWYWFADALMAANYKVNLANPAAMKQYDGLKNENDETSAFFLAEQLRLGILPCGYIYPKEERSVRDILRRRLLYVHQRTSQILSFQSLYSRETGGAIGANKIKQLQVAEAVKCFEDEHCKLMAESNITTVKFLGERIRALEKVALGQCRLRKEYEKLLTTPGIGMVLGLTIMLETGPINRFEQVGNYTSYCRCVRATRESNSKKIGQNNSKNGNKYLAWAYVEAANFMIRNCEEAKRWYQRKMARCGGKRVIAIKALAGKIAKACYFMMKDQVDFDVKKIFG